MVRHSLGKGQVVIVGIWAGLTYSAKVRRADYDMRADFDPSLRNLIVAAALVLGVLVSGYLPLLLLLLSGVVANLLAPRLDRHAAAS